MKAHLASLAAITLCTTPAFAISDGDLRAALEQRFKGDRTGACVAAAVIDGGTTASAYFCANPNSQRAYDEHTAFEIGSVTKTMTAALLAEFIARGEVTLNDPIAKLLPPGTSVPSFNGRQITIGEIVTHTSGLPAIPAQYRITDMNNPYASVTERDLLGALAATQLTRAPGSQWEYSNFAMMVLSYALAKRSGKDYETLLRERLLVPLGMNETYVAGRPPQVRLAQGHFANTMSAIPWDFPADMAGVGGVRATLPDMVRYLEGELGTRESAITPALALTQQQVASVGGHTMGMNWEILSTAKIANGRTIIMHGGGTGGYSSFVAFAPVAKRAAVLLRHSPHRPRWPRHDWAALARPRGACRRAAHRRNLRCQADRGACRPLSLAKRSRHGIAAQGQRADHPGGRPTRIRDGLRQCGRFLSAPVRRTVAAETQSRRHLHLHLVSAWRCG
jgi:serine-type D-Ala-D-Ala carboxypeptidase/endopeptidase